MISRLFVPSFLIVLILSIPSAWGRDFPFAERVAALERSGTPVCTLLTIGRPDSETSVAARQRQLDLLYGTPASLGVDPQLANFLSFFDAVISHKSRNVVFGRIRSLNIQGSAKDLAPVEDFLSDLGLFRSYLKEIELKIPNLSSHLQNRRRFLEKYEERIGKAILALRQAGRANASQLFDRRKNELSETISNLLQNLAGTYGELQIALRLKGVISNSFFLSDLFKDESIDKLAKRFSKEGSPVSDVVSQIPAVLLPAEFSGSLNFAKAKYILNKEFDLRIKKSATEETWIEVKNFHQVFNLASLHSLDPAGVGMKIKKQVFLGLIARKILKQELPKLNIRLELHFLGGIADDAKAELETMFEENMSIVSGGVH